MTVKENLTRVRSEIAGACRKARRNPASITIVGVSKGRPVQGIIEAVRAGITDIGENREQELALKYPDLASIEPRPDIHFIGHLQGNKVKSVVEMSDYIHSVDSLSLLRRVHYAALDMGKVQNVFLQVNTSGEPQKFGMPPGEVESLLTTMKNLPYENVKFTGLMTIAPLDGSEQEVRQCFQKLYDIKEHLNLHHLSMGMSNDFRIAVEEGATVLRIGRRIFGDP